MAGPRSIMEINITPLESTIARLKIILDRYDDNAIKEDSELREIIHQSAIKSFEYTYELAVHALVQYMKLQSVTAKASAPMTFNGLIRGALREGLLRSSLKSWQRYRANKNKTSHTYDMDKAQMVFEAIPEFLEEVEYLIGRLYEVEKY